MDVSPLFNELVEIVQTLRVRCPWDRKQTLHSLRTFTLEECYELTDALMKEDWPSIKEELGDVLLHVLFYCQIATEQNQFGIEPVLSTLKQKLIDRHPHVYGNAVAANAEEVAKNWAAIKTKEFDRSVLGGVPQAMPALLKAICIQAKAKQIGFDWKAREPVYQKIEEELSELQAAVDSKNQQHIEEELGDVFFSLINYARFIGVNAETALEKTNLKFIARFKKMETIAQAEQKQLTHYSTEGLELLWQQAKTME